MTTDQIVVIVAGLMIGYWLVSMLFRPKGDPVRRQNTGERNSRPSESTPPNPPDEGSRIQSWSEVLGVSSSAEVTEIKSAYRRLIIQYHPDKVASLGPELRALAEVKSRQITNAYTEGMRGRE